MYSRLTASDVDNINCDQTEMIGKKINMKLDNVVVTDATIKRKDQIRTLGCLKVGVKIDNENVYDVINCAEPKPRNDTMGFSNKL